MHDILEKDLKHIWHPFTQAKTAKNPIPIKSAKGCVLTDYKGKEYLDMVSSWWVNVHGHCHPKIAQAIYEQAQTIDHIIFADFTHEPAVMLVDEVLKEMGSPFKRGFYSDNGSTSVEVALKMCLQYWKNLGSITKRKIIAFEGGYHGDTFGSMAVGKSSNFFKPFEEFFFDVEFIPFPETWINDDSNAEKEQEALAKLEDIIKNDPDEIAGIIIEPFIQGAGGMRFCSKEFMTSLMQICQKHNILTIFDEVMTGFGRTGKMFAFQYLDANLTPDFVCMSKGLSGGILPLALTVTTEKIYKAFWNDDFSKCFAHGHSFTGNPISCRAGLTSFQLFKDENTLQKIADINAMHIKKLGELSNEFPNFVERTRTMGAVAAFNLSVVDTGYSSSIAPKLKQACWEKGLLIRPLGNVVYLTPPFCISPAQLSFVYDELKEILKNLFNK